MTPSTPPLDLPNKAYIFPQAVDMWPPVWWTWLVLALAILLLTVTGILLYRRRQKRTYRREALAALKKADDTLLDKELIILCHELIRRCLVSEQKLSLAALPVGSLMVELDKKRAKKHQFQSLGDDFINGPYRSQVELNAQQKALILSTTRHWIRKHHA